MRTENLIMGPAGKHGGAAIFATLSVLLAWPFLSYCCFPSQSFGPALCSSWGLADRKALAQQPEGPNPRIQMVSKPDNIERAPWQEMFGAPNIGDLPGSTLGSMLGMPPGVGTWSETEVSTEKVMPPFSVPALLWILKKNIPSITWLRGKALKNFPISLRGIWLRLLSEHSWEKGGALLSGCSNPFRSLKFANR